MTATPSQPVGDMQEVEAKPGWSIGLDTDAAKFLRDLIDAGDEPTEITLSLGYLRDDDGKVQYGLRVHETEYPEEGASLLVELPDPKGANHG